MLVTSDSDEEDSDEEDSDEDEKLWNTYMVLPMKNEVLAVIKDISFVFRKRRPQ
ncbi:hypothetical protein Tco_0651403, partial [Tanacetum coccineum]